MMESVERSLAELRAEISPSSADKARLRARIVAPTLAGGTPPAPLPPLTRWGALQAAGSLALAGGVALLGAGLGIGFWLGRGPALDGSSRGTVQLAEVAPPAAPPPSLPAPPPPADAPARAALEPAPESGERSAEARRSTLDEPPTPRATRPRARPRAAVPEPLNGELALLQRVERALRKSDPALALALLTELDERFPESRLVEERLAARHMADCRLDAPDAVERARRFLDEHPASVYRQRIQLACALGGDNPGTDPRR